MPRARKVVMGKVTPQESYEAGLKKAVKLHSPYAVVPGELLNEDEDTFNVIYKAPLGGDREVVASYGKRSFAVRLCNRLNRAWAQGYWSSGRN